MLDPISAAVASSAFATSKKALKSGVILSLWLVTYHAGCLLYLISLEAEKQEQNPPLFKKLLFAGSVEEEAVQMFAAKKKKKKKKEEQQREDLKVTFSTRWVSLLGTNLSRWKGRFVKDRQETVYKQAQLRKKFIEYLAYFLTFCV